MLRTLRARLYLFALALVQAGVVLLLAGCNAAQDEYPDSRAVLDAAHRERQPDDAALVRYYRAGRPGEWWVEVERGGTSEWYGARKEGPRWAVLPWRRAERAWWPGRFAGRARPSR